VVYRDKSCESNRISVGAADLPMIHRRRQSRHNRSGRYKGGSNDDFPRCRFASCRPFRACHDPQTNPKSARKESEGPLESPSESALTEGHQLRQNSHRNPTDQSFIQTDADISLPSGEDDRRPIVTTRQETKRGLSML
jgi:hypothetical protein